MTGLTAAGVMACCVLLTAVPAMAQDAPPPPPPGFEGTAEFSFVGTSGNSSTQTLGAGSALTFRWDGWTLTSKTTFVRNEDRDTLRAQSFAQATEAGKALNTRLSVIGRHEYQRDRFAGIRHRHTVDAGVAIDAIETATHVLKVKSGLGYANERRLSGNNISTAIGTGGLAYTWTFSESAAFDNTMQAELSLTDGSDRRVSNIASLSAKLNSTFSLKVKHTTRWVKSPAPGFRKTDTITAVALVAKF